MEQRVLTVSRMGQADAINQAFETLTSDADVEYAMNDGSVVEVHRLGRGAKEGTLFQANGRSRASIRTKMLALSDAPGNLVDFCLTQSHAR